MGDMRKPDDIDNAFREIAMQRDELLTTPPTISRGRQAALALVVARQFPLETSLRSLAAARDLSLHLESSRLSASVESMLRRHLVTRRLVAAPSGGPFQKLHGLKPSSLGLQFRSLIRLTASRWFGIVLAACAVVVAVGLLLLSAGSGNRSHRDAAFSGATGSEEGDMRLFSPRISIGPFNLETNQPASLQASFLARRDPRVSEGINGTLGLRVDLPVPAFLTEESLARIP
jgi:hypothetical protein